MLKISIPNNNINERNYIINVIFDEFLGIKHTVVIEDVVNYEITLGNRSKLIIEDDFFNAFQKDLSYLNEENIPNEVTFIKTPFTEEYDIPLIFGSKEFEQTDNSIMCGIDIFASSFYMLTRWEEYAYKERDGHDRFPAHESLAFKNNFLSRPIVNEYVEMLWNMLSHLGVDQERKERLFNLVLTHDVDFTKKYCNALSGIKEIVGDVVKRRDLRKAFLNLKLKCKSHFLSNDPYNTFDYLMTISEQLGVKSHFFFMGKGETDFDNNYKTTDRFVQSLVKNIKSRGHLIGMHPSYNAFKKNALFQQEKNELENSFDSEIKFGREHYLRFEVPTTWQIWNDNEMEWDSTMGYADKEGFRCGTCYEFPVYNILTQRVLSLKEKPLVVMEGSFMTYQNQLSAEEMTKRIIDLISTVKKYNGDFVFLWHNSSFNDKNYLKYRDVYERVLL